MPLFARLAALILAAVLVFAAAQLELFHSLDSRLGDMRFAATSRPASGDIVMVDIDAASLAEIGVWPWPRRLHAQLLDRLLAMDAAEIVFDIDFSTASNAADDEAFAAALESAGGYAFLAAFQQQARAGGDVDTVLPLPRFRAFADPVAVNVIANQWGDVTAIRHAIATPVGAIPSVAAALAMEAPDPDRTVSIDYGIDLATIDRVSAADILAGRADPARIAGRQVVIGASAIELHDLFQVPRFGRIPGALVQAAATETVRSHRGLTAVGGWPIAVAAIIAGAARSGAVPARQRGGRP
jgi:CHASE2 domain-containing sensor protein